MPATVPLPDLDELIANFSLFDDWEERYHYVIDLGDALEPMHASHKIPGNKVEGCVSQVWLSFRCAHEGVSTPHLYFQGDSDARIVRGLIAILSILYNGQPVDEISSDAAHTLFQRLGLAEHLTPQRSNGFYAMTTRLQMEAEKALLSEAEGRDAS
ncbi:MAG: SufE family protein [Parvularculales bacterium]